MKTKPLITHVQGHVSFGCPPFLALLTLLRLWMTSQDVPEAETMWK